MKKIPMSSLEVSTMIAKEIAALHIENSLPNAYLPNEDFITKNLVLPRQEYYGFKTESLEKEMFWTVWDEGTSLTEQRYVIIFNDREKVFCIGSKPSNLCISQYKDSFIACLNAL